MSTRLLQIALLVLLLTVPAFAQEEPIVISPDSEALDQIVASGRGLIITRTANGTGLVSIRNNGSIQDPVLVPGLRITISVTKETAVLVLGSTLAVTLSGPAIIFASVFVDGVNRADFASTVGADDINSIPISTFLSLQPGNHVIEIRGRVTRSDQSGRIGGGQLIVLGFQ